MSGIDRVRKPGYQPFPIRRRSADPLQPESGAAEFEQALDDFSEERIAQVQEADEVMQSRIQDQEKPPERNPGKHPQKKEETENEVEEDNLIDVVI